MTGAIADICWAILFVSIGASLGALLILVSGAFLPRFLDKMTPNIDEEKEIVRGNVAVAEYFGRVVGASILGISMVIAAAVLGGLISALH